MKKTLLASQIYAVCAALVLTISTLSAQASESPFRDLVDITGSLASEKTSVGKGKWTLVM